MPNACRLYLGPVHSKFTAAFSCPTTLVLSWAGTKPLNPNPYCGSSEILKSHFRVLNMASTSPTVRSVDVGIFEPVPTVPGEVNVPVRQLPRSGSFWPNFKDGK